MFFLRKSDFKKYIKDSFKVHSYRQSIISTVINVQHPRNVVAPFGNCAIFSYHSVNSAIFSYHLVNSEIVLHPVVAFRFEFQSAGWRIQN